MVASSAAKNLGRAAAAAILVTGLLVIAPQTASAEPECLNAGWDFDRDRLPDVAVGSPGARSAGVDRAGSVQVRLSNDGEPYEVEVANPSPHAGDRFGAALAELASYDNEGEDPQCTQLVVGAPGDDLGAQDAGTVWVFTFDLVSRSFGVRAELRPGVNGVPGVAQAGAAFGSAVAAREHLDDIAPIVTTLFVGAPGANRGSTTAAGSVTELELDSATPTAENARTFFWGEGGRFNAPPSANGRFGSALAVSLGNVVFVGAPGQRTAGEPAGGAVEWVAYRPPSGGEPRYGWVSQASAGVPGGPETGDGFGSALAVDDEARGGRVVLIGAPAEDIGRARDAGALALVPFTAEGVAATTGARGFDQGTTGVAGAVESADRFGAAVTVMEAVASPRPLGAYLVGAPGETIGSARGTGMVQTLTGSRSWSQDTVGVPGSAEAGDAMGSALSGTLVGVPGENSGAGRVIAGLPIGGATSEAWSATTPSAGDDYGSAVGSDGYR